MLSGQRLLQKYLKFTETVWSKLHAWWKQGAYKEL